MSGIGVSVRPKTMQCKYKKWQYVKETMTSVRKRKRNEPTALASGYTWKSATANKTIPSEMSSPKNNSDIFTLFLFMAIAIRMVGTSCCYMCFSYVCIL
jgi:hypothetical protein